MNTPTLKKITLNIKTGRLYGICGKVGSGKSSFLEAVMGELPFYSGKVQTKGKAVYCEQHPTIFAGTIRENIVFGRQFEEDRYRKVVNSSALEEDFQLLEFGDETMVGEKGATLSGGQRARICLARTLYSEADIYIFDDPLSAVNSKVASQIFKGIQACLEGKTILVSTHITHFLEECDHIIFF